MILHPIDKRAIISVPTRSDLIYNDDYCAYSLFRNRSPIIDRFKCSGRMDYYQYRRRQSCNRVHINGTMHSIVVKSWTYVRALQPVTMATVPEPETPLNNRHPTRRSSRFSARIETGTSSADQPRPRSPPSMSWQFVFVDYQWHPHPHRRERPRPLASKINLA